MEKDGSHVLKYLTVPFTLPTQVSVLGFFQSS